MSARFEIFAIRLSEFLRFHVSTYVRNTNQRRPFATDHGTNYSTAGGWHSPVISDRNRVLPERGVLQPRIHGPPQNVYEAVVLLHYSHHEEGAEVLHGRSCHRQILQKKKRGGGAFENVIARMRQEPSQTQTTASCFESVV